MSTTDQQTTGATGPAVGSAVRLLPIAGGDELTGRLTDWSTSPAGLVATAAVALAPAEAAAVVGEGVWGHLQGPDGSVLVLEALAEGGAADGEVLLTGVLALVSERRRAEPRADVVRRAQLRGPVAAAARTVDLSRTGARVVLPVGADVADLSAAGAAPLEVLVEVADEQVVSARAEVVRVDEARAEVAVRFVDLAEGDAARIDRVVLGELSSRHETQRAVAPDRA